MINCIILEKSGFDSIAFIALLVSIIVAYSSYIRSKLNLEIVILNRVDRARELMLDSYKFSLENKIDTINEIYDDIENLKDSHTSDSIELIKENKILLDNIQKENDKVYKYSLEEMLNAYEFGCKMYLERKINRQRFRDMYNKQVKNLFLDKDINEYISKISISYPCLKEYYKIQNEKNLV